MEKHVIIALIQRRDKEPYDTPMCSYIDFVLDNDLLKK